MRARGYSLFALIAWWGTLGGAFVWAATDAGGAGASSRSLASFRVLLRHALLLAPPRASRADVAVDGRGLELGDVIVASEAHSAYGHFSHVTAVTAPRETLGHHLAYGIFVRPIEELTGYDDVRVLARAAVGRAARERGALSALAARRQVQSARTQARSALVELREVDLASLRARWRRLGARSRLHLAGRHRAQPAAASDRRMAAAMKRAIAHAHLQWLVQLVAAVLAAVLGGVPWTGWPILIALLFALAGCVRLAWGELAQQPRLAIATCMAGQLPGLVLGVWVLAGFARLLDEPFASMAWLQAWTIAWTPIWSSVPDATFHRRGLYTWLIAVLPLVQLALTLRLAGARPVDLARGARTLHAER